jgi:hypothetical protein
LYPVYWKDAVNCTIDGTKITKTGTVDAWNTDAISIEQFYGDCCLEFTPNPSHGTGNYYMIGFNHVNASSSYTDIDYALYIRPTNALSISEQGLMQYSGTWTIGDIFRLEIINKIVKYYQNGILIYTSSIVPVFPLFIDAAIYSFITSIDNIKYDSLGFSATGEIPGSRGFQVIDTAHDGYSWFKLDDNTLDGSHHPFDATGAKKVGLISKYESDANGKINRPVFMMTGLSTDQWHIPNTGILNGLSQATMVYKLYLTAYTGQYQTPGWKGGFFEISVSPVGKLRFGVATTARVVGDSSYIVPLNTVVTVALVYNGSYLIGYADGQEVYRLAQTGNITDANVFVSGDPTYTVKGCVSDVMFYKRALTSTELQWLTNGLPDLTDPDLISWHPVDDEDVTLKAKKGTTVGTINGTGSWNKIISNIRVQSKLADVINSVGYYLNTLQGAKIKTGKLRVFSYASKSLLQEISVSAATLTQFIQAVAHRDTNVLACLEISELSVANSFVNILTGPIIYSLKRSDTLNTDAQISHKYVGYQFEADDVLRLQLTEVSKITNQLKRADELDIVADPVTKLRNVHTLMDSMERKVYCKVEITYTDPNTDADTIITVLGTAAGTETEALVDGTDVSKYKWFSLSNNTLDGTNHPIDAQQLYPAGWWGTKISDDYGSFAEPEIITIQFSNRTLDILKVDGDDRLDEYPVDFTIQLYNNETLMHTETVTNNTTVHWTKIIASHDNVNKLIMTVTKINTPYNNLKLTELFTSTKITYQEEELEYVNILEEIEYEAGAVTLGAISSNEVDLCLDNSSKLFSFGNDTSKLKDKLRRNRKVIVWFGVEVVPNEIEWHQMGVYWTTEWKTPTGSLAAYATARDRLNLLEDTDFDSSDVYLNKSLAELFGIVFADAGLNADEYIIDTSLNNIIIPYAWFDKMSHREALQRLAGCALIKVYCNRTGQIVAGPLSPTQNIMNRFLDDTNIFEKDFPLAWSSIVNYVEATTTKITVGATDTIFTTDEPISIPANSELTLTYNFDNVPCVNIQAPTITSDPEITIKSCATHCWGFDITLQNSAATSKNVTGIAATGQIITPQPGTTITCKNTTSINTDGKVKMSIKHDFIQDAVYAQSLATNVLNQYSISRQDVMLNCKGDIAIQLEDKIGVETFTADQIQDYVTIRQEYKWNGYLEATTYAKKL